MNSVRITVWIPGFASSCGVILFSIFLVFTVGSGFLAASGTLTAGSGLLSLSTKYMRNLKESYPQKLLSNISFLIFTLFDLFPFHYISLLLWMWKTFKVSSGKSFQRFAQEWHSFTNAFTNSSHKHINTHKWQIIYKRNWVPSGGAAGFTTVSLTFGGGSFSFTGTWKWN